MIYNYAAKIVKNYEVVARRAIKYSYERRVTNYEKRREQKFYIKGAFAKRPYNVTKSN